MIARLLLSILLFAVMVYAWSEYRRSPVVGLASMFAGAGGLYFVWFPDRASALAELAGIGRGADLIIYTWVAISLLILLNLHLKLRAQMELITALAREMALAGVRLPTSQNG